MKKVLLGILLSVSAMVVSAGEVYNIWVAAPAGSGPDVLVRKVSNIIEQKHNVSLVVLNRPGGSGAVALAGFNNSVDKDKSIYFGDISSAMIYPLLSNKPELVQDLEPAVPAFKTEFVLAVSPKIAGLNQLLSNKNLATYGSWGMGSPPHIAGEDFSTVVGFKDAQHIPYKEYTQWFTDISTQRLTYSFVTIASTQQLEKAGAIKYLAILSDRRNPQYPNLPTLSELTGQHAHVYAGWAAFYLYTEMPSDTKKKLISMLTDAVQSPEYKLFLSQVNYIPWSVTGTELKNSIQQDSNRYKNFFKKYNISIN